MTLRLLKIYYTSLAGWFRKSQPIADYAPWPLAFHGAQRWTMLIQSTTIDIQHMQTALTQMNLQLHHVLADITGKTGMRIIRAINAGERCPKILAGYRDHGCKNSLATIEQALTGHYRAEHLFSLQQALELYDIYQEKIAACDCEIEKKLAQFSTREISTVPLA